MKLWSPSCGAVQAPLSPLGSGFFDCSAVACLRHAGPAAAPESTSRLVELFLQMFTLPSRALLHPLHPANPGRCPIPSPASPSNTGCCARSCFNPRGDESVVTTFSNVAGCELPQRHDGQEILTSEDAMPSGVWSCTGQKR